MKRSNFFWAAVICAVFAVFLARTKTLHAVFAPTYLEQSISITSSTVPQNALGPNCVTWSIRPRTAAAAGIFCWHYSGTSVPASVPATCTTPTSTLSTGCQEIPAGASWTDNDTLFASPPTQQSVACALETGVTAVSVDTVCR